MAKIITSTSNDYIKHLAKLRNSSSYRKVKKKVLIEGKHIIQEHPKLCTLIVKENTTTSLSADEIIYVNDAVLKKISGVENPEGYLAEVDMPEESPLTNCKKLLVLDAVSDPGNLGTLFRTACAFGWSGIFLLPGCCDPYNDKALRAAKGATFKIPFRSGSFEELKALAISSKLIPLCADLEGDAPEIYSNQPLLLTIGNESLGLSQKVKTFCKPVTLAMHEMESLNASIAGAILLYILKGGIGS